MKNKTPPQAIIPAEFVEQRIFLIRGRKVMLDFQLAELYQATTGNLNLAVRRNSERFPEDFMFQLTKEETKNLILQFAISSYGGRRHLPHAFTEHGVAMLSSVLKSKRAVQTNILIIRAFMKLREMLATHKDLANKMAEFEKNQTKQALQINAIIKLLMKPDKRSKRPFGFTQGK